MAVIPKNLTDWCRNIFTQKRPWSESNNLKWKMIVHQAELGKDDKYIDEEQKECTAKSKILEDSMLIT